MNRTWNMLPIFEENWNGVWNRIGWWIEFLIWTSWLPTLVSKINRSCAMPSARSCWLYQMHQTVSWMKAGESSRHWNGWAYLTKSLRISATPLLSIRSALCWLLVYSLNVMNVIWFRCNIELGVEWKDGKCKKLRSTLIAFGDASGETNSHGKDLEDSFLLCTTILAFLSYHKIGWQYLQMLIKNLNKLKNISIFVCE